MRRALNAPPAAEPGEPASSLAPQTVCLVRELFAGCKGNARRVEEELSSRYDLSIPYSTLTRAIRDLGLRDTKPSRRSGAYAFAPGQELQHDTSPHRVVIAGKPRVAQCAALVLAFSRRLFVAYFPSFTRFEARSFLHDGFSFMDGVCPRVTIDNTSVFVASGAGPNATIAPEMAGFGRLYGVTFVPHGAGEPDRKGRVERAFRFIESNFLAGREFSSWADLNAQARAWCESVANHRPKRALGMTPEAAYVIEKPHLTPLPSFVPPVFQTLYRVADTEGYVSLDTNRYSVPDRLVGKQLELRKLPTRVQVFFQGRLVAEHERLLEARDARTTDPAHHRPLTRAQAREGPCPEETALRGKHQPLDAFLDQLKARAHGRAVWPMRRLLTLYRSYPERALLAAIRQASTYGLTDLGRLEQLILSSIAGDAFRNPEEDEGDDEGNDPGEGLP